MSSVKADIIYIGKKPLMTYVTSAIIQLATMPMITIKARGQSMGTAIDVTQIVIRKTKPAFSIADIKIGSESLVSSDGRNRDVSTIDISIKRNTP